MAELLLKDEVYAIVGAAIGWLAAVPPVVLTVVCLAPLAFVPVRRALRRAARAQPKRE